MAEHNTMRKFLIIIMSCTVSLASFAQDRISERTYISTDRDCYVSGDNVWMSAFCVDSRTGQLSDFSSIAYVEIHSSKGLVQTGKIALKDGRGAGRIVLQNTLPTGNYKIIAYTAQSRNESGYDYSLGEKVISIFNTFTGERVEEDANVLSSEEYAELADPREELPRSGAVRISGPSGAARSSMAKLSLTNTTGRDISLSLSVYNDDGIIPASGTSLQQFLAGLPSNPIVDGHYTPDYEGEVLRARANGPARGLAALISVPGPGSDVYSGEVAEDGSVYFVTNNIYGDSDLVTEVVGADSDCHLEFESQFVNAPLKDFPVINLCEDHGDVLLGRSLSMQIEKRFEADTLFNWLPVRQGHLLNHSSIKYRLDDYTRFPTMEEVAIEFIPELRFRRNSAGTHDLQVRLEDSYRTYYFSDLKALLLLDGVAITEHESIFKYDPTLVEAITIYPYTFVIGGRIYGGLVNFSTYKGNLPSIEFGRNVRVVNFQGASYPLAYTCANLSDEYPDYRRTIYWHPVLELKAGESVDIDLTTPAYGGQFRVVLEGLESDGTAVREYNTFEIK